MTTLPLPVAKRLAESIKSGCRRIARPLLPAVPDVVTNRLPFLGRIGVRGPGQLYLRMLTYGAAGKDRIALKLARKGLVGYEGETIRVFLPLVRQASAVIDIG